MTDDEDRTLVEQEVDMGCAFAFAGSVMYAADCELNPVDFVAALGVLVSMVCGEESPLRLTTREKFDQAYERIRDGLHYDPNSRWSREFLHRDTSRKPKGEGGMVQ